MSQLGTDRSSEKTSPVVHDELEAIWLHATPHEGCRAEAALALLTEGVDRAGAVQQADLALRDDSCVVHPRCSWRAMAVLLFAGELMIADAQLRRIENVRGGDALSSLLRAQHSRLAGNLAGARTLLSSLVSGEAPPVVRSLAAAFLVEALVQAGEVGSAEALLAEHDFDRLSIDVSVTRPLYLAARGAVHLAAGRFSRATVDFLECVRLPTGELVCHSAVMRCRGLAALAARADGRTRLASTLVTQEAELALAWGSPAYVGWSLYARAMVEQPRGSTTRSLNDAIDLLEVAGSKDCLAFACHELGTRLIAAGDDVAAKEKLERARVLARELENKGLEAEVRAALQGLAQADQHRSLTLQELRIAELARAGYSNKQIAKKLFLTVRTIEFHLSNVYRKLGISGRRELADGTLKLS